MLVMLDKILFNLLLIMTLTEEGPLEVRILSLHVLENYDAFFSLIPFKILIACRV